MNENIDLKKILEGCPKGEELASLKTKKRSTSSARQMTARSITNGGRNSYEEDMELVEKAPEMP